MMTINWRDLRPHESRSEYKERIRQTEEDLERLFEKRDKPVTAEGEPWLKEENITRLFKQTERDNELAEALGEMLGLLEDHACLDGMSLEELTLWLRAQRTLKKSV